MLAPRKPAPAGGLLPWASWIGPPPSFTSSPLPLALLASEIRSLPVCLGMSHGCRVSSRLVAAILPSGETRVGPARPTPLSIEARARKPPTRAFVVGLSAPPSACQTTSTVLPENPPNRCWINVLAVLESEPGVA
jgi:hypothetical protein